MSIALMMLNRSFRIAGLTLAVAGLLPLLSAQGPAVGAPATSYVYDSQAVSIRRLIGIAGSSFLGDVTLSGMQFAAVAPDGLTAIAVWQDRVEWISDPGAYPSGATTVGGALPNVNQIVWDLKASSAALFSSADGQVRFVQLSGGAPAVINAAASDWCSGAVSLVAADPRHSTAVVSCQSAASSGLFVLSGSAAPVAVQASAPPVAAAFGDDGSLYLADNQANVSVVRNPAAGSDVEFLFNETDLTSASAAILVQSSAGLLYSADATQNVIRVYDLNSFTKLDQLPLYWQPTQFQPFSSTSFLLNIRSKPSDPMILLRTSPRRSVLFVPAGE